MTIDRLIVEMESFGNYATSNRNELANVLEDFVDLMEIHADGIGVGTREDKFCDKLKVYARRLRGLKND